LIRLRFQFVHVFSTKRIGMLVVLICDESVDVFCFPNYASVHFVCGTRIIR
jgi:hypothetical protein